MNIVQEVNQFYQTLGTVCPKYKGIRVTENELQDEHILSEILYDIEDNIYVYENAADLVNGIKHYINMKNIAYKAIKYIGATLMVFGFIFMLGTAGASDNNAISLSQTITQSIISLGVMALGFVIIKKMED